MLSINSWKSSLKIENQPDEFEVKALLQSRAVDTPRGVLIEPGAFEDFLARTPDFVFPCVAKVCDPEIIHKTDRGGLELGFDRDELERTAQGTVKPLSRQQSAYGRTVEILRSRVYNRRSCRSRIRTGGNVRSRRNFNGTL